MDSTNRRKIFNVFIFSIFILLVSLFLIFNYLGDRFAPTDANADNSAGRYVYTQRAIPFEPFGNSLGRERYQASSRNEAYSSSGYKVLTNININANNIPLGTAIQLCVTRFDRNSGFDMDVICDLQNLETSSATSWQFAPSFGILLEPSADYYCKAVIDVTRQEVQPVERYKAALMNCELIADSIDTKEQLGISLAANPYNSWGNGNSLHPALSFKAEKDLQIMGKYTAVGGDSSLSEQSFADICINVSGGPSLCADGQTLFKGVDSRFSNAFSEGPMTVREGQSFSFSCRTQEGRSGICQQFAFLQIDKAYIQSLQGGALSRSQYYSTTTSDIDTYCEQDSYLYGNNYNFVGIDSDANKISRCKAILSSSSY